MINRWLLWVLLFLLAAQVAYAPCVPGDPIYPGCIGESKRLNIEKQTKEQEIQDKLQDTGISNVQLQGKDVKEIDGVFHITSPVLFSINVQTISGSNIQLKKNKDGILEISGQNVQTPQGKLSGAYKVTTKDKQLQFQDIATASIRNNQLLGASKGKITENTIETQQVQELQSQEQDATTHLKNGKNIKIEKKGDKQTIKGDSADELTRETNKQGYQFNGVGPFTINENGDLNIEHAKQFSTRDNSLSGENIEGVIITKSRWYARRVRFVQTQHSVANTVNDYIYFIPSKNIEFNKTKNLILNTKYGVTSINDVKGSVTFDNEQIATLKVRSLEDNNIMHIPTPLPYAPTLITILNKEELLSYKSDETHIEGILTHDNPIHLNDKISLKKIAETGSYNIDVNKTGAIDGILLTTNKGNVNGNAYFTLSPQLVLKDISLTTGEATIYNHTFINTKDSLLTIHEGEENADIVLHKNTLTVKGKTTYLFKNKPFYESAHKDIISTFTFTQDNQLVDTFQSDFTRKPKNYVFHSGYFTVEESDDRYFILNDEPKPLIVRKYSIKGEPIDVFFNEHNIMEIDVINGRTLYVYNSPNDITEVQMYQNKIKGYDVPITNGLQHYRFLSILEQHKQQHFILQIKDKRDDLPLLS